jgi:hypothetical protein
LVRIAPSLCTVVGMKNRALHRTRELQVSG